MYRIRWTTSQSVKFVTEWLEFRAAYGLTQQELAAAIGIDVRTVQRIERRRYVPRNETVVRFREVQRKYRDGFEVQRSLERVPGSEEG